MSNKVRSVPEDFYTITPHLVVQGVARAVEFYQTAFGAKELYRNMTPDGEKIVHSEMFLGDSRFFINDEFPDHGTLSPNSIGGTGITLHLYVEDVDSMFQNAVDAGAEILMPVADMFWGDRYGILIDPFGHRWSIASQIEELSPEEINQRSKEFFSNL